MNVIPPLTITAARFTSSTVVDTPPAEYIVGSPGTTYAINETVSVYGALGLREVYKSLQNGNQNNTPSSSPTWWRHLCDTYQVYSSGTTYTQGEFVLDDTNHLIYESLISSNLGNALTDTAKWLLIGPSNKWAMFDFLRNTATVAPFENPITVVITPGVRVDSIALLGLVANSYSITMTSVTGGGTVYTATGSLDTRIVGDWYDYFFEVFSTAKSVVFFNLPPYTDGIITVVITATSGNAECGACVVGSYEYIGDVQYDADADVLNFSSVTRDFAGGTSQMVQRRNVPRTIQQIFLDKTLVNRARALRESLNAVPAVWSGLDDSTDDFFESFIILGFYKRFSINAKDFLLAVISLELEEI